MGTRLEIREKGREKKPFVNILAVFLNMYYYISDFLEHIPRNFASSTAIPRGARFNQAISISLVNASYTRSGQIKIRLS